MRAVFVDSGAFFALLVAEDAMHERATRLFAQAEADKWALVTTNFVLVEAYALLLARTRNGRQNAIRFLDHVAQTAVHVERVRRTDEAAAMALVRAHEDKSYSLCDALSFVVMERLGLAYAFAFDRHFHEYGRFIVL